MASFTHDIFIKGCQINFTIDGPQDVEVSTLYPDEAFRTLDDCFDDYLVKIDGKPMKTGDVASPSPVAEPMPITATCA